MIYCHNCLQEITASEYCHRLRVDGGRYGSKVIYIHWPRCPEEANSAAHYEENVMRGVSLYNLIEEAKYVKEGML